MPYVTRPTAPVIGWEYVYLIRMGGSHKIGRCKSWERRRKAFSGLPAKITLLCLLRTQRSAELEAALHAKYAPKRLNGEWFALAESDVEEIRASPLRVR